MIGRYTQQNTIVSYYNVYFMYNFLIISYLFEKFKCYSDAVRWDIFFLSLLCPCYFKPKSDIFWFQPLLCPLVFYLQNQHFFILAPAVSLVFYLKNQHFLVLAPAVSLVFYLKNQHFTFHFSEPLCYHFFLSCHYSYIKSTRMLICYRLEYKQYYTFI